MALFEHDIETGRRLSAKGANQLNRIVPGKLFKGPGSDKDAFSSKVLQQFSKGMISGKQFTSSMKLQGVQEKQLGTMVNFMKSDLRLQASTNQFTQRKFRLDKDALRKTADYYALDKKVRREEREFYKKTKEIRKRQYKKDKEEETFRRHLLKAITGIEGNTQTLQTARRLKFATSAGSKLVKGAGKGIGLLAKGAGKLATLGKSKVDPAVRKSMEAQTKLQKAQNFILRDVNKTLEDVVGAMKRVADIQERGTRRRDQNQKERERVLKQQGINPKQTRHERQKLIRTEQRRLKEAKKIGGFWATDEERQARANLKREAKELSVLRKRGFTTLDIQKAKMEGVSQSELVESGRHRRRTRKGITGSSVMKLGRGVGGLGAKLLPGLGLIAGAAASASKIKQGDFVGGLGSAAAGVASIIPGLGPLVGIVIETLTQLLPDGIKESVNKFAGKIFGQLLEKIGFGGQGGMGGGGKMAEFGTLFVQLGDALRNFGDMFLNFLLSEPVVNTLKKIFDFVVEGGKLLVGGLTGILNFFVDIFSGDKGFIKAYMDNLGPVMVDLVQKLIPKAAAAIWEVFKIMAEGVKTLVVSIIGKPAAKMFGIVVDSEKRETKIARAGRMIVENQDLNRSSRRTLVRVGGTAGLQAKTAYDRAGGGQAGLEAGMSILRAAEASGTINPSDAKTARTALFNYHTSQKYVEVGKQMARQAKADAKSGGAPAAGGASTTPAQSAGAPAITPTANSPATTTTPTASTPGGKSSSVTPPTPTGGGSFGEAGGGRIKNKKDPAPSNLTPVGGGHRLQSDAAQAWKAMVAAARKDGIKSPLLSVKSGYRSSKRQAELFQQAVAKYGSTAAARKWVAPPGGSAHQSGRAVDLNLGIRNSSSNVGAQRKTQVWAWLNENATKFGFYPYQNEPWHWEYNPPAGGLPSVANVSTSMPTGAEESPAEAGVPGSPGGTAAATGGISGVISGYADQIMAQGANFASGIAGLPGMSGAMGVGQAMAASISSAMQGASAAAMQEMQRVNMAMSNALQSNPAMKTVNNNMDQMSRNTQAMANKHDDPEKSELRAKRNRSVEALFAPYRAGQHFTG